MAQIHGQIGTLKQLRKNLDSKRISRFNSIREINDFMDNFQEEKYLIVCKHKLQLTQDIEDLSNKIDVNRKKYEHIKSKTSRNLDCRISTLSEQITALKQKNATGCISNLMTKFSYLYKTISLRFLNKYYSNITGLLVSVISVKINRDTTRQNYYTKCTEKVISKRSAPEIKRLEFIKETIEGLSSTIAGAVGENLVVKEVEKLSNDYIVINDFNFEFNPSLLYRGDNSRIHTIQIDHLLISRSGVFVLETKNWNQRSINSSELRSPVEQIKRSSYAIYRLLSNGIDSGKIKMNEHHWGGRKIPVRNVIVMTNAKPVEEFSHVRIKSLSELNSYITCFERTLSNDELVSLADYFIRMNQTKK